jgi:putative NADH-flavin reductase
MTGPRPRLKIAIIGASGHLGGAIAREALSRGHEITAIARDASRLRDLGGATVISADVLDPESIKGAVAGHDAVVASVTSRPDGQLVTIPGAARTLLSVLPEVGVGRLVFAGGGGSLEAAPGRRFVDLPEFPAGYKNEALAQAEALAILRADDSGVEWSYASPPPEHLIDGGKSGVYRMEATDRPVTDEHGESRITVADYASAIVDVLENHLFPRQRFTAAY